ncbi:MAG: gamma-glutamylcyclotransferase [Leptolyngbyaceae cyanobacterium CSU_1_4]|nr:gamma-glutamylcyclotransferase [Leptolyngbyaceae cyanobacterium CSU_1_4]
MTQTDLASRRVFICGSALRGQPDHQNLQAAQFICETQTSPLYRFHAAADGWHPAIYAVAEGGISIPGEVYELTMSQYDHLISTEPPDMYPGDIVLENGEIVTAILYPRALVEQYNWPDISHYGGWAAYKRAVASP